MITKKTLILIGGNSRLAKIILSSKDIRSLYQSFVIFVSRPFIYHDLLNANDKVIVYTLKDIAFSEFYNDFLRDNSPPILSCDVFFAGTPSNGLLYDDKTQLKKTIDLVISEKPPKAAIDCTVYIFGSILAFIPFFGDKNYKIIKTFEYNFFCLHSKLFDNIYYLVLPPIGQVDSKLGRLFSTTEKDFSSELIKIVKVCRGFGNLKFVGKWHIKFLTKLIFFTHLFLR